MRFVDVNVMVHAHRRESPDREAYLEWLERARVDREPLALSDMVLAGFLRVVTNHRIFKEPTSMDDALGFVGRLQSSPASLPARPSPRVWDVFQRLVLANDAKGNAVPDVYLAASAIDLRATLVTADRRFARFEGLTWAHPLN